MALHLNYCLCVAFSWCAAFCTWGSTEFRSLAARWELAAEAAWSSQCLQSPDKIQGWWMPAGPGTCPSPLGLQEVACCCGWLMSRGSCCWNSLTPAALGSSRTIWSSSLSVNPGAGWSECLPPHCRLLSLLHYYILVSLPGLWSRGQWLSPWQPRQDAGRWRRPAEDCCLCSWNHGVVSKTTRSYEPLSHTKAQLYWRDCMMKDVRYIIVARFQLANWCNTAVILIQTRNAPHGRGRLTAKFNISHCQVYLYIWVSNRPTLFPCSLRFQSSMQKCTNFLRPLAILIFKSENSPV